MNQKCSRCQKISELCVCSFIQSIPTQTHVLILQHPQEPDQWLGSARLAHLSLPNSTLRIGLSWPNLKTALAGSSFQKEVQPSQWVALYLGSGIKKSFSSELTPQSDNSKVLNFVSRSGTWVPKPTQVDGVVILDGTWSQAKALWWRNAWLLKLKRAILQPSQPSLYRSMRKEPKRECLSTIESIAETLSALGEPESTRHDLRKIFTCLLNKQKLRLQSSTKKPLHAAELY